MPSQRRLASVLLQRGIPLSTRPDLLLAEVRRRLYGRGAAYPVR